MNCFNCGKKENRWEEREDSRDGFNWVSYCPEGHSSARQEKYKCPDGTYDCWKFVPMNKLSIPENLSVDEIFPFLSKNIKKGTKTYYVNREDFLRIENVFSPITLEKTKKIDKNCPSLFYKGNLILPILPDENEN